MGRIWIANPKMSTRNERRQQWALLKRKSQNPKVLRLVKGEIKRGQATEIYRMDGGEERETMYFNISEMREWAERHCEVFAMPVDFERAERLLTSGAIDQSHMLNYTTQNDIKPIIVCRGLDGGGDQIVDGAHTFVAICLAAAKFGVSPPVPAYVLQQNQWERFIISADVAEICGIEL
jgi:hypothetical protein